MGFLESECFMWKIPTLLLSYSSWYCAQIGFSLNVWYLRDFPIEIYSVSWNCCWCFGIGFELGVQFPIPSFSQDFLAFVGRRGEDILLVNSRFCSICGEEVLLGQFFVVCLDCCNFEVWHLLLDYLIFWFGGVSYGIALGFWLEDLCQMLNILLGWWRDKSLFCNVFRAGFESRGFPESEGVWWGQHLKMLKGRL